MRQGRSVAVTHASSQRRPKTSSVPHRPSAAPSVMRYRSLPVTGATSGAEEAGAQGAKPEAAPLAGAGVPDRVDLIDASRSVTATVTLWGRYRTRPFGSIARPGLSTSVSPDDPLATSSP